jgi:hypothetical protein
VTATVCHGCLANGGPIGLIRPVDRDDRYGFVAELRRG